MDPEKADKALAAVAKAMGLDEGADRETMLKALDAIIALKEALSGEKPKDEPAPAEEPAPEAAATAAASADEAVPEDADVVEASDAPAETADEVELMDEPGGGDALAGEALSAVGMLAESSGMSPEEVVAMLRDKAAEVAALLAGAPADGSAATDAPMSSHDAETASVALTAAKAGQAALKKQLDDEKSSKAKLAARIAELESEGDARMLDDAISKGHVLEAHRKVYLTLARHDRAEFRAQLAEASASPAVPVDDVVVGKGKKLAGKDESVPLSVDPQNDDESRLVNGLRAAKVSEGRIAKRLAAHRESQG